jgi:carboxy-cis,cis-muconate cyclase
VDRSECRFPATTWFFSDSRAQHDKKNLYGTAYNAAAPGFASYSLVSGTDIVYNTTLSLGGNCTTSKAIFVVAASEPPYNVYGSPFGSSVRGAGAGCGNVMAVDQQGVLAEVVQNYSYYSTSGVHGMALDAKNAYLYSADDSANTLWTHKVDNATGELSFVSAISGPATGADPRHVAVHPEGKYLYLLLEGANEVGLYTIDEESGEPTFTNVTYPLIPSGKFQCISQSRPQLSLRLNFVILLVR